MSKERDYAGQVATANIDATVLAAQGIPVTAFLEALQTEFDTGKAQPSENGSAMMQGMEFLCNQNIVDWKGVTLATGMFMATSVHRGIKARKNAEYQDFMMKTEMELGNDTFAQRAKERLVRGAAIVGAYAVGTKLNLGADLVGAVGLTAGAVGYGAAQSRKMGWRMLGRKR
jgi:hypothetical protein